MGQWTWDSGVSQGGVSCTCTCTCTCMEDIDGGGIDFIFYLLRGSTGGGGAGWGN